MHYQTRKTVRTTRHDLTKFDLSRVNHLAASDTVEAPVAVKRVLLAEDGLVNQEVAVGFLKQRGHHVTVVGDGQQAVDSLSQEQFDVILMDVQMPVMDGLQATELIRKREQQTDDHIPIIAMTANAMKGDRQRCLDSGMDAYLAKPVDREELCRLVETTLCSEPEEPSVIEKFSGTKRESSHDQDILNEPMINWQRMSKKLPGGLPGVRKLAGMFITESQLKLRTIQHEMFDLSQMDELRRACHTLKSSAGMFECDALEELAFELEQLADREEQSEVQIRFPELELLVKQTQQCCESFLSATDTESL